MYIIALKKFIIFVKSSNPKSFKRLFILIFSNIFSSTLTKISYNSFGVYPIHNIKHINDPIEQPVRYLKFSRL